MEKQEERKRRKRRKKRERTGVSFASVCLSSCLVFAPVTCLSGTAARRLSLSLSRLAASFCCCPLVPTGSLHALAMFTPIYNYVFSHLCPPACRCHCRCHCRCSSPNTDTTDRQTDRQRPPPGGPCLLVLPVHPCFCSSYLPVASAYALCQESLCLCASSLFLRPRLENENKKPGERAAVIIITLSDRCRRSALPKMVVVVAVVAVGKEAGRSAPMPNPKAPLSSPFSLPAPPPSRRYLYGTIFPGHKIS